MLALHRGKPETPSHLRPRASHAQGPRVSLLIQRFTRSRALWTRDTLRTQPSAHGAGPTRRRGASRAASFLAYPTFHALQSPWTRVSLHTQGNAQGAGTARRRGASQTHVSLRVQRCTRPRAPLTRVTLRTQRSARGAEPTRPQGVPDASQTRVTLRVQRFTCPRAPWTRVTLRTQRSAQGAGRRGVPGFPRSRRDCWVRPRRLSRHQEKARPSSRRMGARPPGSRAPTQPVAGLSSSPRERRVVEVVPGWGPGRVWHRACRAGTKSPRVRSGTGPPPGLPPQRGGCLLYTSPSPRDGLLSRMPSSA